MTATAIERASAFAAYTQKVSQSRFQGPRATGEGYPLHIVIDVGDEGVLVRMTRLNEIPGDVVVDLITAAVSDYLANSTGTLSSGGLYARFVNV